MKIEAGKFYRTRDGRKVGPMSQYGHKESDMWRGILEASVWTGRGSPLAGTTNYLDAEWTDEPAAPTKWGEMTDAEKGALLLAHHEGKTIEVASPLSIWRWERVINHRWYDNHAYRVRPPEPVREKFSLHGYIPRTFWKTVSSDFDTHRITFDTINGEIPTGTYTNEDGERIVVERVND